MITDPLTSAGTVPMISTRLSAPGWSKRIAQTSRPGRADRNVVGRARRHALRTYPTKRVVLLAAQPALEERPILLFFGCHSERKERRSGSGTSTSQRNREKVGRRF